jgi:type IV pilus assembly protein PilM
MKFRRSYGLVGVDLGSHAIKLAQIERAGTGLRVINARTIVRASHAESSGVLDWWEEALAHEKLNDQFLGNVAACVASAPSAELQMLTIPDGSRSEQRAMLEGELASQRAEPVDHYEFDFWRIPQTTAAAAQENVAVATLAVIDGERIAAAIAGAGLVCTRIEPKPSAIARASKLTSADSSSAVLTSADASSAVAVLDWGYDQACLTIVKDGRPAFHRNLRDCGYKRILTAVVHALEISVPDAQILLSADDLADTGVSAGTLSSTNKAIDGLVQKPLQSLVTELQKTLNYVSEHRRHLEPAELVLCGGGATIRQIAARLGERTPTRVRAWQCDSVADCGLLGSSAPIFTAALGLSGLKWSGDDDL